MAAPSSVSAAAVVLGKPLQNVVRIQLANIYKRHYSEEDAKKVILTKLQQVHDGMQILLNREFEAAKNDIETWLQSSEPIDSKSRKACLKDAKRNATLAFTTVTDPLDKVTAAFVVIFAEYHNVALQSSPPSPAVWAAGKSAAQRIFIQYVNKMMPQLESAAKEELSKSWLPGRSIFSSKKKRQALLQSFVTLSFTVYEFYPSNLNHEHPRFEILENASVHMMTERAVVRSVISPKIGYLLDEPRPLCTLKGQKNRIRCCAVFAEGTRAIIGSGEATKGSKHSALKVWDLSSAECLYYLHECTTVYCCAVFNDGTSAISGSLDTTLKVWELSSKECLFKLEGHNGVVSCCSLFCGDTKAISGSADKFLKVWSLSSRKCLGTLEGHGGCVTCCSVFSKDTRAISGSEDRTLKVWALETYQCLYTLVEHEDVVKCCAVFANGNTAISGSVDGTLKVWDLESSRECSFTLPPNEEHKEEVTCCKLFANDTRVISGHWDNTLKIWDLSRRELLYNLESHAGSVECCTVFADDTKVLSGSDDGILKIWQLPK